MPKTNGTKKEATSVRVPWTTLTNARVIAKKLNVSFTDYFNLALHDANKTYEKKLGKKWASSLRRQSLAS